MPTVVGVRFKPVTKIYYFNPNSIDDLALDDRVVVETARGFEMGQLVMPYKKISDDEVKGQLKPVVRKATPVDLIVAQEYKTQEEDALATCKRVVSEMHVPMKVLQATYSFDGSRLIFEFTAEHRVDFRDLVKELAKIFRTRIEMKQVGARDETKILDGYGRCGRQLCCSSWLTEFHPVSIRMAKHQGLPLAPPEISGVCGRLLCCLAYEEETYKETRQRLPKVGTKVKLDSAIGIVKGVNILKETLLVESEDEKGYQEIPAESAEIIVERPKARPSGAKKGRGRKPRQPQSEQQPTETDHI